MASDSPRPDAGTAEAGQTPTLRQGGVLEKLIEARYTRDKSAVLAQANLSLEKLRVLLRICHEERHLDHRGYEYAARNIDEAGRMVGGWLRSRGAP